MATTYYNDIQKLYVAYFNRPADTAGLKYWEGVVEAAKGDTSAVSASFAASGEYQAAYKGMTSAQIVSAVYQNLFGRTAEAAGVTYWSKLMDAGTITIDQVVTQIAHGAQGSDMTAYNDKVSAAYAFTTALDTPAEQAGYTGDAANALAKAFISSVTDDASLSAAIAPANLNVTVGNVVAASGVFAVASGLASYDAAVAAETAFLKTVDDGDSDATTHNATEQTVADNLAAANTAVVGKLGANGTVYTNGSDAVKTALINDQIAANASALATAQDHLATANANIAKVAGLSAAISTLTAAQAAQAAADKAVTAADADLAAKAASFAVTTGTLGAGTTTDADGNTVNTVTVTTTSSSGTTTKDVATVDSTGKLTLIATVDATKYTGLTDYIASKNADVAAHAADQKAIDAVASAQLNVNHLDVDPNNTEAADLATVTADIKGYGDVKVAAGATATEAQIQTELTILTAKANATGSTAADATNLSNFQAHVDAYHTSAASNPLVDAFNAASTEVKTDTKAISDFTKVVTALHTAQADAANLAGYEAAVTAAHDLFDANGFNLVNIDTDAIGGVAVGTAASDVFVAGSNDAIISLFGLQGNDSLYIGTGYTLTTGKLSAGDDAKLEAFVAQSGSDTTIKLEQHAYSSHVAGTTGEIVTITLTGVDASTVHLDNNGIITVHA